MEILESGRLLVEALDLVGSTLEGTAQSRQACRDIGHALARESLLVAEHLLVIGALGNVVDSCHDLQLSRTLVYVHDAGIAVETLAGVVLHEARAAVYLYRIESHLIGILRSEHLGQRREAVGKAVVELHLGTLVGLQRTLVRDMVVLLVDIDEARRLVEQRPCGQRLGLHVGEHLRYGGEADDRLAELLALVSVLQRLAICGLAQSHRLRADTQTCGVHERHHIFDKAAGALVKTSSQVGEPLMPNLFSMRRTLTPPSRLS